MDKSLADMLADVIWVVNCIANQTPDALQRNIEKKTLRDSERHRNNPKLIGA